MLGYHRITSFLLILLLCSSGYARTLAPLEAKATILEPKDGTHLVGPVHLTMRAEHLEVAPAGLAKAGTGHFVLLVDVDGVPLFDRPLPGIKPYYNYSGGQSSVELNLDPGVHSLQLVMVDHEHRPHSPPVVSKKIYIRVLEPDTKKSTAKDIPVLKTKPAEKAQPVVKTEPAVEAAEPAAEAKLATEAKPTAEAEPAAEATPVTKIKPAAKTELVVPTPPTQKPAQYQDPRFARPVPAWNNRGPVPGYSYGMGQ